MMIKYGFFFTFAAICREPAHTRQSSNKLDSVLAYSQPCKPFSEIIFTNLYFNL